MSGWGIFLEGEPIAAPPHHLADDTCHGTVSLRDQLSFRPVQPSPPPQPVPLCPPAARGRGRGEAGDGPGRSPQN
eukprot:7688120-Pyramimonas_sp.AAC.1